MLNKLRYSKFGLVVFLAAAIKSTLILPVQQVFQTAAIYRLATAAVALGGSSVFTQFAWAEQDLRGSAAGIGSATRDNVSGNLQGSTEEGESYLFGTEDDRGYNNFHSMEDDEITDENLRGRSGMYKSQVQNDSDSTEGQVYKVLQGVAQDEGYHTRDRDNQAFGDKVTLVNTEDDPEFLEAFQAISGEMEDGMVCRPEIVSPAEYQTDVITTREYCTVHNGEAWAPGSCKVSRSLQVPMLQGGGITNSVQNGFTRRYSSDSRTSRTFDLYLKDSFSAVNVEFDKFSDYANEADFEIILNGTSLVVNKESIQNGAYGIRSHAVEGENTIETLVHPIGYAGTGDVESCTGSKQVHIGTNAYYNVRVWHAPTGGHCGNKSCTQTMTVFVEKYSCRSGSIYTHRQTDIALVTQNGSMGTFVSDFDMNIIRNKANELISGLNNTSLENCKAGAIPRIDKDAIGSECYITPIANGLIVNPAYIGDFSGLAVGPVKQNLYRVLDSGQQLYCGNTSCSFGAKHFSLAWSEATSSKLSAVSPSFVNEIVQDTPIGCSEASNLAFQRKDGMTINGLDGKFLPVTPFSNDGVSNEYWTCTNKSASRLAGNLSGSLAVASEIGNYVAPLFPGVNGTDQEICYEAEANNLAIDLSRAPLCPDGTLNCYGSDESDLGTRFDWFLDLLFDPAHASSVGLYLQADSSCNVYEAANNCRQVSEQCIVRSPVTGDCVRHAREYDCDEENTRLVKPAETKRVCEASIPCSTEGEDGFCTYTAENSDSFTDAAVQLSVTTFARNDQNCFSDDPMSCVIFPGEKKTCRSKIEGLAGTGNCCNEASEITLTEYIMTFYSIYKIEYVENMTNNIGKWVANKTAGAVQSGWQFAAENSNAVSQIGQWASDGYDYAAELGGQIWDSGVDVWNAGVSKVQSGLSNMTGAWESMLGTPSEYAATQSNNLVSSAGSLVQQQGESLVASSAEAGGTSSWGISASFGNSVAQWGQSNLGVVGEFLFQDAVRDQATGKVLGHVMADGTVAMVDGTSHASLQLAQQAGAESGVQMTQGATLSQGATAVLGYVMWAYMAYQIIKMIHSMMIACKSHEVETSTMLKMRSCTFVEQECTSDSLFGGCRVREDRHCCFTSPLARIIHEQAFASQQHPFDTKKEHYDVGLCRGLWFSEFAQIDFGHPDFSLDEWIAMLMDANKLPDPQDLDEFFNEDNLTKSVARHYETEDEVGNTTERSSEVVDSFIDVEEMRRQQRETLLAEAEYDSSWRDCGYIHDVLGGVSYMGRERYAVYADGQDKILESCQPNPDGGIFTHQYNSCPSYQKTHYKTVTDANGTETQVVDWVETVIPRTIFINGLNNEYVEISQCNDAKVIRELESFQSREWRFCGFEQNMGLGLAYEKFRLVATDDAGIEHEVSACAVQAHSKNFQHKEVSCGFIHGKLDDSGVSRLGRKMVFTDADEQVHEVTECKAPANTKEYPHYWVQCDYLHDVDQNLSKSRYFLALTDDQGNQVPVAGADQCEVRSHSNAYQHDWERCEGYTHYMDEEISKENHRQFVQLPEGRVDFECKPYSNVSRIFNHEFPACDEFELNDNTGIASQKVRRIFMDQDVEVELEDCRINPAHSATGSLEYQSCGFEHRTAEGVTKEKLQLVISVPGTPPVVEECSVIEGQSQTFTHYWESCGDYSHNFDAAQSSLSRRKVVNLPPGVQEITSCGSEGTLVYQHLYDNCQRVRPPGCSIFSSSCRVTPVTTYFYTQPATNSGRVNARVCYHPSL